MARPWSAEGLAAASREPEHRLSWYADAGLLHREPDGRFAVDSLHRLRLIQFARHRGITDEQLAAAAANQGDLLGFFEDLGPANAATYDLVEVAREAGIDEDLIQELMALLNQEDVEAGAEEDVAAVRLAAQALALGLPRDALLQLVHVYVDLTDRLAEAENRIFHEYVHERFRAQGLAGRELLEATEGVGRPLMEFIEPAVLYFHRRAWRQASREDLLRHLAEETIPPSATPGETQATVMFVDLASFTPLTAAMGDQAAADVLRRFSTMVRNAAAGHGGRIIKQIGDAFMLVFTEPRDAIRFGLALDELVGAEPQFPALHIGAHYGAVLYREGDYVGGTVNLAARVASAGAAGQFLVTEDLCAAAEQAADRGAEGRVDADLVPWSPRPLKGLPEPVRLVEVRRHGTGQSERETDPVCGMLLHPEGVAARATWHGAEFAFCSTECERAFAAHPTRYVGRNAVRRS